MDTDPTNKFKVRKRKAALNASFCVKKERSKLYQKVSTILQKPAAERSKDEIEFLSNSKDIVHQIGVRRAQRQKLKDRAQEYEDPADVLAEKCKTLAEAVMNSNHLVVYTGAGISTAACIPDYRGTNGIWTLLQQGKDIGLHDLSQAEPTLTHMALYCLYRSGILKHIVSQNCDGLHLRSGIPRSTLSEVHGNMYLEVCSKCKPSNHYLRLFDVTEYTARYSHETLRLCYKCGSPLKDTIVHFGERGKLQWPLNWDTACKQADKADVILCLGSSLKVLKKYPWLWCMDKPVKKRPKLYIVNLQWTPKDDHSTLKINGRCDSVIERMMSHIGLTTPLYVRSLDPIFYHATILHESEIHTTSRIPIQKNLPIQSSAEANCLSSQNQQESGPSNDFLSKLKNDALTGPCVETISDITSPKDESIDAKMTLVNNFSGPERNSEVQSTDSTSGLSANIKAEPISDECREIDTPIETDDLVNADSNDSVGESVEMKEETSIDASSDKENHEFTNLNVDQKDESPVLPTKCDVEKMIVEETVQKQSSVTVIQQKSIVEAVVSENQTIEELIEVKNQSLSAESEVKALNHVSTSDVSNSENTDAMQTFGNGLNLLCGRSLWSELSFFDTLTNQPILFGRSILGWSDMNPCSFNSTSFTDCTQNGNAAAATETVPRLTELTKEKVCLFCFEYYCSRSCLFYAKSSSNLPLDATSVCLCCGGDDDDDEQQEEPEEDDDKAPAKVSNINPGWFGKGYKRKVKYKKK